MTRQQVRYRCPRCGQSVGLYYADQPPPVPPSCSCGLTDDGRPRLAPIRMIPQEKDV